MKMILFIFLMALTAQSASRTFTGIVTDTMCGRDHTHMNVKPDAKCVRDCVKSGHYKYALHTGDRMYILSDQATPEKFAAQKVRITGVLYEKTGVLKVEKIEAAK